MGLGFIGSSAISHILTTPSSVALSSFTCRRHIRPAIPGPSCGGATRVDHGVLITMKKGRYHRGMPQRPQQQQQPKLPEDGTPIFALFVRTPRQKIWYPLGAVQGDDRSKNLVNSLKGGFSRGMYEQALDRGMAQTLYGKDNDRFLQGAFRLYPQLKKFSKDLEFGYRVAAVGLEEQQTRVVSKDMALPFFAAVKKRVSDWVSSVQGK